MPPTGYISPDTMVVNLATLSRLKPLHLGFQNVPSHHDQILPPPIVWNILPALCKLFLCGVFEYLEDFLAQIDTPQLESISLYYLDQGVNFEGPQLSIPNISRKLCLTSAG
jgi:hypothetical protein